MNNNVISPVTALIRSLLPKNVSFIVALGAFSSALSDALNFVSDNSVSPVYLLLIGLLFVAVFIFMQWQMIKTKAPVTQDVFDSVHENPGGYLRFALGATLGLLLTVAISLVYGPEGATGKILAALERTEQKVEQTQEVVIETKKTVDEILDSTTKINMSDLVRIAKDSENPFGTINKYVDRISFDEFNVDDLVYIGNTLGERKSMYLSTLQFFFLGACNDISEQEMIDVLSSLDGPHDAGRFMVLSNFSGGIESCLNEATTEKFARFMLKQKSGAFVPITINPSVTPALTTILNSCEKPIEQSFFEEPNYLSEDTSGNLMFEISSMSNLLKFFKQDLPSCISNETAVYLNEKYNRQAVLANGWYLPTNHFFSSQCLPKVTPAELERAKGLGVSLSKYMEPQLIEGGCLKN